MLYNVCVKRATRGRVGGIVDKVKEMGGATVIVFNAPPRPFVWMDPSAISAISEAETKRFPPHIVRTFGS